MGRLQHQFQVQAAPTVLLSKQMVPTMALRLLFGECSGPFGARAYSTLGHHVLASFRAVPCSRSSPARRRGSLEIFQHSSFQGCNRNSQTDHSFASLQDRQAGSPRQLLAGVISDISEENPPCQLQLAICFHGK